MNKVRPKKTLGQHFLTDKSIAQKISATLTGEGYESVLEIGPGMGVLTDFLLKRNFQDFRVIEIDNESVHYLHEKYPGFKNIITGDFLGLDVDATFKGNLAIIGNFPYNISSQILFKALQSRDKIVEISGMLQKEVAERICSGPGSKVYGILSVLLQAFYSAEYLFTVPPGVFSPPPRVMSGVIRLRRKAGQELNCDTDLFFRVVKATFNHRRKTLRNSVKAVFDLVRDDYKDFNLRPEQLSVGDFEDLTNWIEKYRRISE